MNKQQTLQLLKAIGVTVGNIYLPGSAGTALPILDGLTNIVSKAQTSTSFQEIIQSVEDMEVEDWDDLVQQGRDLHQEGRS